MTDVVLKDDSVEIFAHKLIVKGSDLELKDSGRLIYNEQPAPPDAERRALVHSGNDSLTINYDTDYRGGVIINGEVTFTTAINDFILKDEELYKALPLGLKTNINIVGNSPGVDIGVALPDPNHPGRHLHPANPTVNPLGNINIEQALSQPTMADIIKYLLKQNAALETRIKQLETKVNAL